MAWQYAIAGAFSLFGAWNRHRKRKKEVEAENRRRLNHFYDQSNAYVADNIIKDTTYKNEVIQYQTAASDYFDQAVDVWRQQDQQLEGAYATHAFNVVDALTERYKNEYAGEQTGVTASRLAAEPIRQAGYAITKSVRNVILAQDTAIINKEISANTTDQQIRAAQEQVRYAPMRTHAPQVPDLEEAPSQWDMVKDFGLGFASSALGLWAGGLKAGDKLFKFKNAITGVSSGLHQINTGNQQTINPWIPKQTLTSGVSPTADSSTSSANNLNLTSGLGGNTALDNLIGIGYNAYGGSYNNLFGPGAQASFNVVASYLGQQHQWQSGINVDPNIGSNRNLLNTWYRYPSTYKFNPAIWGNY